LKVTLNWIKEFLNTDKLDPSEVAEMLTMSGTEVEKVEAVGKGYEKIVVGRIESFTRHPDADKLSLCKVDSGAGLLDIVCGATNFKQGDRVALALEGACLGELKIKRSKIRGQYSEGMMCSEAELGLSAESAGIMILDEDFVIGDAFAPQVGLDDVVFDLEITPNRPDCLSVIGIAREISAMTGFDFNIPVFDLKNRINRDNELLIDIEDYNKCSRYSAMVFGDVPDRQSPIWLKNRLVLCGVRPIDLMVDLTNYVMLETGQPLHAFDGDLLYSKKIIVRNAVKDEKIKTIDDTLRKLDQEDLVIADEEKAVALAGVMGGKETEVNDNTRNVLLESANFFGPMVMKTSQKTGLRSEASNRFEKKIDAELTVFALGRFEQLLRDITGYELEVPVYDNNSGAQRQRKLKLRPEKVAQVLGQEIDGKTISKILGSLGIKSIIKNNELNVEVPSFRFEDLEREIDLIEEVARIYGYNNIKSRPTVIGSGSRGKYSQAQANIKRIRNMLANAGLNEVINYSFIGMDDYKSARLDREDDFNKYISIANPINEDFSMMRTSLLPSLLGNVKNNINRNLNNISIFEIAKTFRESGKELPDETMRLGILLTGSIQPKGWLQEERYSDLYDIKGIMESLVGKFYTNPGLDIAEKEYSFFHPRMSADIEISGVKTGIMGRVHPGIIEDLELGQDIFYAEIDLDMFNSNIEGLKHYSKISSFPSIDIDLAIVVDKSIKNDDIINSIKSNGSQLLEEVDLFDIYEGEQIEKGKKSMAYSLSFRAEDRTLKDQEVEIITNRIVEGLEKGFNASLRS
jgi:phenylalanyl-tRNA synthetase beta chain